MIFLAILIAVDNICDCRLRLKRIENVEIDYAF